MPRRGRPEGGERDLLGFDTLTLCPIDRRLIDRAARRRGAAWLDAYHARVRAELIDLVDDETRRWLMAQTAPLQPKETATCR